MASVTRTLNPLHFEDLEPHRFEDLVRQVAYTFKAWRYLEATGRLGADDGLDIRGVEGVGQRRQDELDADSDEEDPPEVERVWSIQCKRYRSIAPKLMRQIVRETIPDGTTAPYGLVVAAACDVSARTIAAFREEAIARGATEFHLWTKAHLEDRLFLPEHDHLLFAYFGISLSMRRRSRLQDVRSHIALKRKLLRALKVESMNQLIHQAVVIRDIEDESYPHTGDVPNFDELLFPPWHRVQVQQFHPYGLLVVGFKSTGWLKPDGRWDVLEHRDDIRRRKIDPTTDWPAEWAAIEALVPKEELVDIRRIWMLEFSQILEVDPLGELAFEDNYQMEPHLFCRFSGDAGPYGVSQGATDVWELWTAKPWASIYAEASEIDTAKRTKLFPDEMRR